MSWVTFRPAKEPKCSHPGFMSPIIEVALGLVAVGSVWKCTRCGAEWIAVSGGGQRATWLQPRKPKKFKGELE